MATRTKEKIKRNGLSQGNIVYYPEAASQTFKADQLVYLTTDGRIAECADDAVLCIGIVKADATGTTSTMLPVDVIMPGDILEVTVYHATAASALCADASVGIPYALDVVSNVCYLDISDTGHDLFHIIGRSPRDSATDVYPRVFVTIPSSLLQSNGAAQA